MAKHVKSEDKPTATINEWQLRRNEDGSFYLVGSITDHPNQAMFADSLYQETSRIVEFNPEKKFAETQNTRYNLGEAFKITKIEELTEIAAMASEVIQEIGDAFAGVGDG
jgi:hypothetical protein